MHENFTEMGFSEVLVPTEQAQPDHRFLTVTSPNPENPSALKMATDLTAQEDADIVFGTDPDTDRLGVAIRNGDEIFTQMEPNRLTNALLSSSLFERKQPTPRA